MNELPNSSIDVFLGKYEDKVDEDLDEIPSEVLWIKLFPMEEERKNL